MDQNVSNGIDGSNQSFLKNETRTTYRTGKPRNVPEWVTLCAIGSVHLFSAMCISLQAPFYPKEAESKGATATEYGLVFGIFEFVAMISSPFLGRYISVVGAKTMLCCGMTLAAVSAILFGLLHYVNDHGFFLSLSLFLRMLEAIGTTSALIAAFSITAALYPDTVATVFSTLEIFYGMGYVVGPSLGGLLFSIPKVGGYVLPFLVMGIAMMMGMLLIYTVVPPINAEADDNVSMFDLLKIPALLLDSVCTVATAITMGYLAATLEPHIREFGLTEVQNGFLFVTSGFTYAITAPLVGRICDRFEGEEKLDKLKRTLSLGAIFVITSYVLIGPCPYTIIPKSLLLCILGLLIHGLGISCLMTPTFIDSICSAIAAGMPNDLSTYGVVSGLWSTSFAFGAFIGPSVSGWLFDLVGFQFGMFFVITLHFSLFLMITFFLAFKRNIWQEVASHDLEKRGKDFDEFN
uniref:Major facilitator superfamily (MFS) profile domain-containing protein n=1 Tax=Lygus hesperus TaxID=30085 RepID=A0A0A9XGD4_LYGHE